MGKWKKEVVEERSRVGRCSRPLEVRRSLSSLSTVQSPLPFQIWATGSNGEQVMCGGHSHAAEPIGGTGGF